MNRKKGLKLFTPVQLGSLNLKHRVVMAPLTRSRSEQPGGIPGDMMVQYYSDRASDGGLIVGEATNISLTARGWYGAPGLYTDQQVEGWKRVVKAIHAKNGFVFAQLWHTGRSSHSDNQDGSTPVSQPPWTHPTGKIHPTWSPLPAGGSNRRHIEHWISPKFQESSRTTGKRLCAPRQGVSTALNFTPATAIYRTCFFKMAATSGRTPTVVPSRTGRGSCWK
jgi:hypothetical protein